MMFDVGLQVVTDELGFSLRAAEPGRIMAQHYLMLDTMIRMVKAPAFGGMPALLSIIAKAAELDTIKLRR